LTSDGGTPLCSAHLGGSGTDAGNGIAVDGTGSAYLTGVTNSTNFPLVVPPLQGSEAGGTDAFVPKVNGVLGGGPFSSDPYTDTYLSWGIDQFSPQTGGLQAWVPLDFMAHAPT
jgi:hypothetical protein